MIRGSTKIGQWPNLILQVVDSRLLIYEIPVLIVNPSITLLLFLVNFLRLSIEMFKPSDFWFVSYICCLYQFLDILLKLFICHSSLFQDLLVLPFHQVFQEYFSTQGPNYPSYFKLFKKIYLTVRFYTGFFFFLLLS